ncbi:MAG: lipopolysaccharide transport periplasmic protein LptA, partial [Deltaproteobacteria bacterium]|nr:lipopolysaccharide transport periplasmic protein LptA [Deltaproteobacteria bacterium]
MISRFLTASITLIAVFFGASTAVAKMTAKVAVLPFEVYSDESPDHLRDTIAMELSYQVATEEQIVVVDQANVKISSNLSLDVYVFDSLGDPPFSKDFVEGNELNFLIRGMARKIRAKVLLIAQRYPELKEPVVVAKVTPEEEKEVKATVDTEPSVSGPVQKEEVEEAVTSQLLPEDGIREETLVEEVPKTEGEGEEKTEEKKEKGDEEVEVAMLPQEKLEEVVARPKDTPKKKTRSAPFASEKPVKITSSTLEADNKRNKITFRGNVVAKQADMVIFSDLMTVKYQDGGGIRRIEAIGNVKMTQKDRIATGKKIVFYNPEQKIIMTGQPRIWQDDNLISCEKVTVLLEEDKIFFEGKVDSTIYPKGMKEEEKGGAKQVEAIPAPPKPKVKAEATGEKEEPSLEKEESLQADETETIRKFILDWKRYWESEDLENYMGCYSKDFSSRGMDWHQWEKYKKGLNDRYQKISLSFSDPQIVLEDNQSQVSFTQYYQADNYSDYGMKMLTLKKDGGN